MLNLVTERTLYMQITPNYIYRESKTLWFWLSNSLLALTSEVTEDFVVPALVNEGELLSFYKCTPRK